MNLLHWMMYLQYPWGTPVAFLRMCSTCKAHKKYPWGCAVPVEETSFICYLSKVTCGCGSCASHEGVQYLWATPTMPEKYPQSIPECEDSTCEAHPNYPWRKLHSFAIHQKSFIGTVGVLQTVLHMLMGTSSVPHRYCTPSWVLHILYRRWHWISSALMNLIPYK